MNTCFVESLLCYIMCNLQNFCQKNNEINKTECRDPGLFRAHASSPDLNQGPSDLQSDALPTELSRHLQYNKVNNDNNNNKFNNNINKKQYEL